MHHEEKQQDQAEQDEERPRSLRRQAISDALAGVIENSGVTHETEHQTNLRRWPVSVTLRSWAWFIEDAEILPPLRPSNLKHSTIKAVHSRSVANVLGQTEYFR